MPRPPCRGTGAAPRACAVLPSCLRHACNEGKTTSPPPPPPHTSAPPRVGDEGREGRTAPPAPRTKRQGGEAAERGCGTDHTTVPEGSTRRASPSGGAPGVRTQGREGDDGSHTAKPPPPAEGQVPRLVPAPCLRRAYARGRTARAPPHPPPSPPPTQKRGEDSEEVARGHGGGGQGTDRHARGRDGRQAVETKKERKKNNEQSKPTRQGKKAGRQGPKPRRTGGGRGDMGPQGTVVKYQTPEVWGPQRGNPPPIAASPCACVVLASCLRHASYKGKTTRATRGMTVAECGPPPPPRTTRQGGEAAERGCGTDHTTVPKGSTRRAGPTGGTTGGATAGQVGRRREPHG